MATPHDELFRRVLADPENAAAWLRGVLPGGLSRRIAWHGIERLPDTFVREHGGVLRTDLLFRAVLRDETPGRTGIERPIYLIPEHVSGRRRRTVLQALRYVLVVLEAHRREHPSERDLPLVLVIVCHHGSRGRFPVTGLQDLFRLDGALRGLLGPYLPDFHVLLDDLADTEPEDIGSREGPAALRLALLALQRLGLRGEPREQLRVLRPLFEELQREDGEADGFLAVLVYASQLWDLTPRAMRNLVADVLGPDAERKMTSTYDQMVKEGLERGLAEGRAEGRAATLLELLEERFGPLDDEVQARVTAGRVEELRVWTLRVLSAGSLDAVFAADAS